MQEYESFRTFKVSNNIITQIDSIKLEWADDSSLSYRQETIEGLRKQYYHNFNWLAFDENMKKLAHPDDGLFSMMMYRNGRIDELLLHIIFSDFIDEFYIFTNFYEMMIFANNLVKIKYLS